MLQLKCDFFEGHTAEREQIFLTLLVRKGTGQDVLQQARTFLRGSQGNSLFNSNLSSHSPYCTSCKVWLFLVEQTSCVIKCLSDFGSVNTSGITVLQKIQC